MAKIINTINVQNKYVHIYKSVQKQVMDFHMNPTDLSIFLPEVYIIYKFLTANFYTITSPNWQLQTTFSCLKGKLIPHIFTNADCQESCVWF